MYEASHLGEVAERSEVGGVNKEILLAVTPQSASQTAPLEGSL